MKTKQIEIPVDSEQFSNFIDNSKIFDKTREFMKEYLTNWYNDDEEEFKENMHADLTTVLDRYRFHNEFVSITKNFNFSPPMDTVSCAIYITDEDDSYCARYRTIFDDQLNEIDDTIEI